MKTNRIILSITSIISFTLFLISVFFTSQVFAQSIVPATLPDSLVGIPPGNVNSASIDYTPFYSGCCLINPQLSAVVADGAELTGPCLFVNDQVNGWVKAPIPAPVGSIPDVVIGNDLSGMGQYIVGVVATRGPDVYLFLYSVSGVGTGSLSLSGAPYYTRNISGTASVTVPSTPHIDIEAQYSTSWLGYPQCNNIAITWQDNTNGVMGLFSSLSNPLSGAPTIINALPSISKATPDVALVERFNSLTFAYEDWALFSYVDLSGSHKKLYYQEWQPGSLPSAPILYDNLNYSTYAPGNTSTRIDAIDDYNFNDPGGSNAYFDIVACIPSVSGMDVVEYNNITGPGNPTNLTAPVAGLMGVNSGAGVTCGPGQFYSVGFYNQGASYYAIAIDWAYGYPATYTDAYQINYSPWSSPITPSVALAGTVNTDDGTQQLFAAWDNGSSLWDKYSQSPTPYLFRKTPTSVTPLSVTGEWQAYPNPATDHITLICPAGFSLKNESSYHITDLNGRELMGEKLNATSEQINIESLSPGVYILNVYSNNINTKTIKFVKS